MPPVEIRGSRQLASGRCVLYNTRHEMQDVHLPGGRARGARGNRLRRDTGVGGRRSRRDQGEGDRTCLRVRRAYLRPADGRGTAVRSPRQDRKRSDPPRLRLAGRNLPRRRQRAAPLRNRLDGQHPCERLLPRHDARRAQRGVRRNARELAGYRAQRRERAGDEATALPYRDERAARPRGHDRPRAVRSRLEHPPSAPHRPPQPRARERAARVVLVRAQGRGAHAPLCRAPRHDLADADRHLAGARRRARLSAQRRQGDGPTPRTRGALARLLPQ